jgi:hypothetical protein
MGVFTFFSTKGMQYLAILLELLSPMLPEDKPLQEPLPSTPPLQEAPLPMPPPPVQEPAIPEKPPVKERKDEGTYFKISVLATMLTAIVALFTYILPNKAEKDKDLSEKKPHLTQTAKNENPPQDTAAKGQKADTVTKQLKDTFTKHPALIAPIPKDPSKTIVKPVIPFITNSVFIQAKILNTTHQYDNDLTEKILALFSGKKYKVGNAGADLVAGSYSNLVTGELHLSRPKTTEKLPGVVNLKYSLSLNLRFLDGTGKNTCGKLDYSAEVSTDRLDDEELVIQRGVALLLHKLGNATDFPFCSKK